MGDVGLKFGESSMINIRWKIIELFLILIPIPYLQQCNTCEIGTLNADIKIYDQKLL